MKRMSRNRIVVTSLIVLIILALIYLHMYKFNDIGNNLRKILANLCDTHRLAPHGVFCKRYNIRKYLAEPHPFRAVDDVDKQYSQASQDKVVYDILRKEAGFFVEIGAYDGETYSNTLWLERKHKWTGLLIEANPDLCKKIDLLKRHAWRLCACLSNTQENVTFVKGEAIGAIENHLDKHHKNYLKTLETTIKVHVPCFSIGEILREINVGHIDFYSLDVEGAEMIILESMREDLTSKDLIVDVWSIEYRVFDGKQVVVKNSLENLKNLRNFFKSVGGYKEHVQLSNDENTEDGYALDVVFVRTDLNK